MKELFINIRKSLSKDIGIVHTENDILFNKEKSQVYITLFQEKLKPIRWG